MPDSERIYELLEEMLDFQRTPEEVCAGDLGLLREVRKRWECMQRVGCQLDALFPSKGPTKREDGTLLHPDMELPRIEGYEVQAVLGRGGMGVVFRARHLKLNRPVALKTLLAGAYAGAQELARFRREAEAVAALRHPNIVQIYDVCEQISRPYFTMEFVEGGSLAQSLAGKPQPARRAAELVGTLASAVQFAHQSGFIHRDLKPANILLTADGAPKVTDFGLVRSIHADPKFTMTGARMGTPSYMAPEQALGKTSTIGPAVDVYALGAILYEMLTGRPPFEGESAAETEQKVIAEEPTPPSRLNPHIPRDLETICLKCLQKNPVRRYASAQDLADDLHRFLDGKPVVARPIGLGERSVKWARRRPALATLSVAVGVLLAASIGLGVWMRQEDAARQIEDAKRQTEKTQREDNARQAVKAALASAYDWGQSGHWAEADRFLDVAASHVADAGSDELRPRIDRAKNDVQFAQRLASVRSTASVSLSEHFFVMVSSYELYSEMYGKAFAEAGFDLEGDAEAIAARIRAAPLGVHTVAALDEWALAAFMLNRTPLQRQLLRITRLADPDPVWRDRLRDPDLWRNRKALLRLADDAMTTAKPPPSHHLTIAGALLRNLGEKAEETRLMRDALLRRPADSWLNWEMGKILTRNRKYADAANYLRVVIALDRTHSWMQNHLGTALCLAGDFESGITHLRVALDLEQNNGMIRHNYCLGLAGNGQLTEARAECRRAINDRPNDPWAYHTLGILLSRENHMHDAIAMLQKAIELRPSDKGAHWNLAVALGAVGRHEEALAAFRKRIDLRPTDVDTHHAAAQVLLRLGRHEEACTEFAWINRELDPAKKHADPEPLVASAGRLEARYLQARMGEVEALLGLGQFAKAVTAAELVLALPGLDASQRNAVQRHEEIARRLAPVEARLAAILAGEAQSVDAATLQELARWLAQHKRCTVAAARLYQELDGPDRWPAICAAALAGSGIGADAASLGASERARWRKQTLDWLQVERQKLAAGVDPMQAARTARAWLVHCDLDAVRAEAALAKLPEAERADWRTLWAEVKVLAERDPDTILESARAHADRKQWAKAADYYARLVKDPRTDDAEVWFEYAAVQLLAGDRAGYRQTCKRMVEAAAPGSKMRGYLMARACTLAPDSVTDFSAPNRLASAELYLSRTQFWSLTEQAALFCRARQGVEALPLLEQSIQAEPRPGATVVNWLWLALAHHGLGDDDEARRWFAKAGAWLDRVGSELPASAGALGLHRHNWLEAHVLRQEVGSVLTPTSSR